jgi:hypothetical protein
MKLLPAFFLALLLAVPLRAAPADSARIGVDCKDDFKKFCKDEHGSSVLKCMQGHRAETSAACLAAMDAAYKPAPGTASGAGGKRPKSCKDDFVRVCKGVKSDEFKACLKERRKELSDFCRKMIDGLEAPRPR